LSYSFIMYAHMKFQKSIQSWDILFQGRVGIVFALAYLGVCFAH
jgi:hypothetical protein